MKVDRKCTIYCRFTGETLPRQFALYGADRNLYYKRFLNGKTPRIKFNVLHRGDYFTNVPIEIVKVVNLEIPTTLPQLPPYTRDRVKDVKIVRNRDLSGTPARIHTETGLIEVGNRFFEFSKPVRTFFLLHEIGHFYYGVTEKDRLQAMQIANASGADAGKKFLSKRIAEEEEKADMFALVHFLRQGFNRSTAMQALKETLRRTPQNIDRINAMLNNIKQTQDAQRKIA